MLHPIGDNQAHITSGFLRLRTKGSSPHVGVDFNYRGGQSGINMQHPVAYSPISGTVISVRGTYNKVVIRDQYGYQVRLLHLNAISVKPGPISAGAPIGTMGNTGLGRPWRSARAGRRDDARV
jgi:murein DD-endopeptidase MepM/ murein hydrolase activator NlpD